MQKVSPDSVKYFETTAKKNYRDKQNVYSISIDTNLFLRKFSRIRKYFITLRMR